MDWSIILVSVVSFAGMLMVAAAIVTSAVGSTKLKRHRIEQLEKRVDKQDGFTEKLPVIEEKIHEINRRIAVLERSTRRKKSDIE